MSMYSHKLRTKTVQDQCFESLWAFFGISTRFVLEMPRKLSFIQSCVYFLYQCCHEKTQPITVYLWYFFKYVKLHVSPDLFSQIFAGNQAKGA